MKPESMFSKIWRSGLGAVVLMLAVCLLIAWGAWVGADKAIEYECKMIIKRGG